MQKYLDDRGEVTFDKIFSQKIGEWRGGWVWSSAVCQHMRAQTHASMHTPRFTWHWPHSVHPGKLRDQE